jgi:hypothetical protein
VIQGLPWVVLLNPASGQWPLVRVLRLTWGRWLWRRRGGLERYRRAGPDVVVVPWTWEVLRGASMLG